VNSTRDQPVVLDNRNAAAIKPIEQ